MAFPTPIALRRPLAWTGVSAHAAPTVASSHRSALAAWWARWRARWQLQDEADSLSRLDAATLRDLGLTHLQRPQDVRHWGHWHGL